MSDAVGTLCTAGRNTELRSKACLKEVNRVHIVRRIDIDEVHVTASPWSLRRIALYAGLLALLPTDVRAQPTCQPSDDPCPGAKWANGYYPFSVHIASFQNNLFGLSLTFDEVNYWIPHALSWWRERTGIQDGIGFNIGTTTSSPDCANLMVDQDSSSELYVHNGCRPGETLGNCMSKGTTMLSCGLAGCTTTATIVEADICIWGDSVGPDSAGCKGAWRINASGLGSSDWDFLGTLAHEFGHALGLDHNPSPSVMLDGANCGTTWRHHPFGDDIEGMRAVYPASSIDDARWVEMTGSTWSSEKTVSSVDGVWGVTAAVAKRGSGENVIVTELSDGGTIIGINKATYPISAGSTWTEEFVGINTWRPPGVAGRPLGDPAGELWVVAVAREQQRATDCPGIRVYRSSDGFASRSSVTLTNHCGTAHEPTLTYDKGTGRFVMAYVRRDSPTAYSTDNGKVYLRTSEDAITWTGPHAASDYSIDAVDIACSTSGSDCLMAFARGDTNKALLRNRKFTVSDTGSFISFGSATDYTAAPTDRTPGVGVRTSGGADDWFLAFTTNLGMTQQADGQSLMWFDRDPTIPFPSMNWTNVGNFLETPHRPVMASVPSSNRIYFWYVR